MQDSGASKTWSTRLSVFALSLVPFVVVVMFLFSSLDLARRAAINPMQQADAEECNDNHDPYYKWIVDSQQIFGSPAFPVQRLAVPRVDEHIGDTLLLC